MLGIGATLLWGIGAGIAARGLGYAPGVARALAKGGGGAVGKMVGKGIGMAAKGATNRTMWSTLAGRGASASYHGAVGGALRVGATFGLAKGIDSYLNSSYSEDDSGAGRMLLGLTSFGLKFSGVRQGIRGVTGTGFAAADRILGKDLSAQYAKTARLMGGAFTKGSAVNWAGKMAMGGLKGVAKAPARIAIGTPYAIRSGLQGAGRMIGIGSTPWHQILNPRVGFGGSLMRAMTNKHLDAPIGHAVFGLSMLGGLAATAAAHDANAKENWSPGSRDVPYGPNLPLVGNTGILRGRVPTFNSADYGGIQPGMKDHEPMAISNLTLGLHRNNQRTMP